MTEKTPTEHPDELLPWYVNATLDEADRKRVARHLEQCARCRAEIAFLSRLREQIRESSRDVPPPGELGLRRLMREVEGLEAARKARPRRAWHVPVLAAAASVVLVVAVLVPYTLQRDAAVDMRLLGDEAVQEAGVLLQVEFVPAASEAEIRALLLEVGAVIVNGPSAAGVYRLRLEGVGGDDAAAVTRVLERLRSRPDVVRHVARE